MLSQNFLSVKVLFVYSFGGRQLGASYQKARARVCLPWLVGTPGVCVCRGDRSRTLNVRKTNLLGLQELNFRGLES